MRRHPRHDRAFSLIEIMVVVVVLGILAAVAIPKFANARDDSAAGAIISQFKAIESGYGQYFAKHGSWPPDNDPAFLAAPYMKSNPWEKPSPIGGKYNWNGSVNASKRPEVCIYNIGTPDSAKTAVMQTVDATLDDGNLATGKVRFEQGSWGGTLRYWLD
jgi:prepilin-type N-terminal cleavage/methylation domain